MDLILSDSAYEVCNVTFIGSPEMHEQLNELIAVCQADVMKEEQMGNATLIQIAVPVYMMEEFRDGMRSL